jgi:hypothetical protein
MDTNSAEVDVFDLDAKTVTTVSIEGPDAALVAAVLAYSPLFAGALFLPEDECGPLLAQVLQDTIRPPGTGREKEARRAIVVDFPSRRVEVEPGFRRVVAACRLDDSLKEDTFGLKDIEIIHRQ